MRQSVRRFLSDGGWALAIAIAVLLLSVRLLFAQVNYTGALGPGGGPSTGPYYPVMPFVYSKITATSGNTYTFTGGQTRLIFTNGSTISALTVGLKAVPYDGENDCFWTQSAITTLTMQATAPPTGATATLNNAATSASATTATCYIYSSSNNTWDRD